MQVGKYSVVPETTVVLAKGWQQGIFQITSYPFKQMCGDWPEALALKEPLREGKEIIIGNDVWIGPGVTLFNGITIGDGAVIGAMTVVAKSVSPYAVVAGNPCIELKKRFSNDDIAFLLKLRWWDWPVEKLREHLHIICSANLSKLKQLFPDALPIRGDANDQ